MRCTPQELDWIALQIDDLSILLRSTGCHEIATQLDAAHEEIQRIKVKSVARGLEGPHAHLDNDLQPS